MINDIKIKYFNGARKLEWCDKGNWIDVYANEEVFIPVGEARSIPLGFAMQLPYTYEAHVLPRSSTFTTWGVILTNHMGIIDTQYCGDNDEWLMQLYCLEERGGYGGTMIRKGDKIGQFRIMESQPKFRFEEVEALGNADRGGYGTTGHR